MNRDQYIISKAIDILSNEPCSPALEVIRARQVERFYQDIQAATPDFHRNNFYPGASIETSASLAAAIVLAHYMPSANEIVKARIEQLYETIDEAPSAEAFGETIDEIAALQNLLQADGESAHESEDERADRHYDGMVMSRNLSDTY